MNDHSHDPLQDVAATAIPKHSRSPQLARQRLGLLLTTVLWGLAVCAGMTSLNGYSSAPGDVGQAASQWPVGSKLVRRDTTSTLIMFVHPCCPCTQASIGELAKIVASRQSSLDVHVCVFHPSDWETQRVQGSIWQAAAAIPGVSVHSDPDGEEAHRFGGLTSGHVCLFDGHGQLQFQGGITGGRGHSGENIGHSAILSLVSNPGPEAGQTNTCSVFGCPLFTQ